MSLVSWLQGFRKTYTVYAECSNCNKEVTLFVPKGFTPTEHFKIRGCPHCGVKGG